jgi:hypothetical protein
MVKMILVGDMHISTGRMYYSLLNIKKNPSHPLSQKFSPKLVHLIESINWIDAYARQIGCEHSVIQLGDIVHNSRLEAEELQMIEVIKQVTSGWAGIRGNHGVANNDHDSDCAVGLSPFYREPSWREYDWQDTNGIDQKKYNIVYLPYVIERARRPLCEYLDGMDRSRPTLILSHNNISGMKYGNHIEKNGWSIEELENWGDIIVNAHIHQTQWVTDKILITGNVDGDDFGGNYFKHPHGIWILDIESFIKRYPARKCLEFVKNSYAMKFASVEINTEFDIEKLKAVTDNRTVLAITAPEALADKAFEYISSHLAGGKILLKKSKRSPDQDAKERLVKREHIELFKKSAREEFGDWAIIGEV